MLKYELKPDEVNKAKDFVKKLRNQRKGWEHELEDAKSFLTHCPNKFYKNTKVRIDYAEKQIAIIDFKIAELKEAIKRGYVEI